MELYKEIGARIEFARKMAGISQQDLGTLIGLSRSSVVNIENGRQRITIENLIQISRVLGISVESFIGADDLNVLNHPLTQFQLPWRLHLALDEIPEPQIKAFLSFYKKIKKG